jgi:peptide/nickel transport system ATP-binding protein
VNDLVASYRGRRLGVGKGRQPNIAVRGISFSLSIGECLAVVGESGSGKTTLGRCLAGLHKPLSGELRFEEQPLGALAKDRPPDVRRRIQLVFQDPDSSLNPNMSIGRIVRRPLRQFFNLSRDAEAARVSELLEQVHLPPSVRNRMPRELSGGEKQRVAIARALAADPELLICDEITSALDVAVQASILELLKELREERALSLLFISHDLAVVRSISDRVLVLRAGKIVELAGRESLFEAPVAAYSKELLEAVPDLQPGDYPVWDEAGDTSPTVGNWQP